MGGGGAATAEASAAGAATTETGGSGTDWDGSNSKEIKKATKKSTQANKRPSLKKHVFKIAKTNEVMITKIQIQI